MHTALYIRVSTADQAEHGHSIQAQERKLRAFCDAKDLQNIKVYTDDGHSGSSLNRPWMQKLIHDVKQGEISTVIVYKLDRLSRSQKDTLYLIEDVFNVNNTALISVSESFDTSTAFGRAMVGMLSVFAQLERENIRDRMMMGKIENAKKGGFNGSRYVTFGYRKDDNGFTVDPYESVIVQEVFDMYLNGKGMVAITRDINERYNDVFNDHTRVPEILSNPFYTGRIKYKDEIYDSTHPAIVDKQTFDMIQIVRKKRRTRKKHEDGALYLLAGLIKCKHCGYHYIGRASRHKNGKHHKYYTCYHRAYAYRNPNIDKCMNKNYRVDDLEKAILERLKAFKSDSVDRQVQAKTDRLQAYTAHLEDINKKIERVTDLYIKGDVPISVLTDRMENLKTEKEVIERNINEHTPDVEVARKELRRFQDMDIEDMDKTALKNMLALLIDHIEIDGEDIKVVYAFAQ